MALADFFVSVLTFVMVYGIFALGLNIKYGFTGLVDFGHVIYFMVGAYVTVVLTSPSRMSAYQGVGGFDLPGVVGSVIPFGEIVGWLLGVAVAGLAAALIAMLIGLLTVRLREDYLAITALGLSVILQSVVNNERWLFNGSFGIREIHQPLSGVFPLSFGIYAVNLAVFGLLSLASLGYGYYFVYRHARRLDARVAGYLSAAIIGLGVALFGVAAGGGGVWLLVGVAGVVIAAVFGWLASRSGTIEPVPALSLVGGELFTLWYVAMPPILQGPEQLFFNLLWLFDPTVGEAGGLDYARFFLLFSALLLVLAYVWMQRTVKSPFGRVLVAIREDEDVAQALGKSTFAFKIEGFALGSAVAGIAGALWAVTVGFIDPMQFNPIITFFAFVAIIIGGEANNKGIILGTAVFWLINTGTRFLDDYFAAGAAARLAALRVIVIGVLLIAILYYRPEGLLGEQRREMDLGGTGND